MADELLSGVEKISIVSRPIAVPYNYRIMYKISQLVLIMGLCCGKKGCSLDKLHMLSLALSSNGEMKKIVEFAKGKSHEYTLIRFDPSINRALSFALAENIVDRQGNGLFRLTGKGKTFLNDIVRDTGMMVLEKENIKLIEASLTEDKINSLKADWRVRND